MKPSRGEALVLALLVLFLALPVLATGTLLGADHDWLTHLFHHRQARDALLAGQLPTWSPWVAGGFPMAGHPEAPFPSPLLLPSLLFGEALGLKLGVAFFALVGVVGTWALAARVGLRAPGRLAVATALACSSWLSWSVADGNYVELHWLSFPAIAAGLLGRGPGGVLAAAALLALVVFDGNVALLTMGVGLVLLLVILPSSSDATTQALPSRLRRLLRLAMAGAGAALLSAGKLPAMVALLFRDSRELTDYADAADAFYTLGSLAGSLLALHPAGASPYPLSRIAMGPTALLLAALALLLVPRRALPWAGIGGVGAWLAMGPAAPLDLFGLLWRLPLLSSVRHPAKAYDLLVVLAVAMLVGLAVDRLDRFLRDRLAGDARLHQGLLVAAVALVALPVGRHLPAVLFGAFTLPPLPAQPGAFQQLQGQDLPRYEGRPLQAEAYAAYLRNEGVLDWKPNILEQTAARPAVLVDAAGARHPARGYRGEAWLEDGAGQVVAVLPRGDGLDVDVQLDSAQGWLLLNQDADPSLVVSGGRRQDAEGLVGVVVEGAGPHRITVRGRPPGLAAGLVVQGLSWLALLGLVVRRSASRSRTVLLALTTAAILGLLLAGLDLDEVGAALSGAKLLPLAAALMVSLVSCFLLESLRWRWLLQQFGCRLPVAEAILLQASSVPLRQATPAKSGLVLSALYLQQRHGLPMARGIGSVLLEKLYNLAFYLLLLVLLPVLGVSAAGLADLPFPRSWAVVAAALIVLGLLVAWPLGRAIARGGGLPLPQRIAAPLTELVAALTSLSPRQQLQFLGITSAVMSLEYVEFALIFQAVGVPLPLSLLVYAMTLMILASNIPVTLGGLGTREATAMVLLAAVAPAERIVAAMALLYLVHWLLPALLGTAWMPTFLQRMGGWQAVRGMLRRARGGGAAVDASGADEDRDAANGQAARR